MQSLKKLAFDVRFPEGNSLLHQFVLHNTDSNDSCNESYINTVLLSMSDCLVNTLNDQGYSALHLAVLKNNLLMVKKLLSCLENIDVNKKCVDNKDEDTPLFMAIKLGHLSIVQELLDKGANIEIKNRDNLTPLCVAARSGHVDIIKLLLSKGAKVNHTGRCSSPLYYAILSHNLATVKILLSHGANINALDMFYLEAPLHYAVTSFNGEGAVKFLLSEGADVNVKDSFNKTPLHRAVCSYSLETVKILISNGADVNVIDGSGKSPLHHAAKSGSLEYVEILISNGADVNAKDGRGKTALHYAVASYEKHLVEFLVRNSADVNAKDSDGETPLHNAIENPEGSEHVKFLIRNGAKVNSKTKRGASPLCYAAAVGTSEIVQFLISSGARVNTKDYRIKETPLHTATRYNRLDNVKLLIRHGSYINAMNKFDETPLFLALRGGCNECREFLEKNGASLNGDDSEEESLNAMHLGNGRKRKRC